jgi:cell division protein FtsN
MTDYYPEFYRQKRQREQAYRRATGVVVGFIVLLLVGGVAGYLGLNWWKTRSTKPGVTPELAKQQQDLQTQQQLASSAVPKDVLEQTEPARSVDLKEVGYSESFPQVTVKLEGAESKETEPAKDDATATTDTPVDEQPPAVGRDGADTPEPQTDTNTAETPQSPQQEHVGSVTPSSSSDDAQRKLEQAKREEQAKKLAARREAAKRKEEEKKREEAKQKAADEAKKDDAARKNDEPKKESESVRPPKASGYTFTVYGGTFLDSSEAEKKKGELSSIGLSGNIIHTGGDYMLMVGHFDDQDSAAALANKLKGSGFGGAFVTRKSK